MTRFKKFDFFYLLVVGCFGTMKFKTMMTDFFANNKIIIKNSPKTKISSYLNFLLFI